MISMYIALGLMLEAGILLGIVLAANKVVDLNKDGEVDVDDVKIAIAETKVAADLNKDGKVDEEDLDIAKSELKKAAKAVNAVMGVAKK